jgi:hypothetical protein
VNRCASVPQPVGQLIVTGVFDDDPVGERGQMPGPTRGDVAPRVIGGEARPPEDDPDRLAGGGRAADGQRGDWAHGSRASFLVTISSGA